MHLKNLDAVPDWKWRFCGELVPLFTESFEQEQEQLAES